MSNWSDLEVECIVTDYFNMLSEELKGKDFNKADHRRNLQKVLNGRSEGSIEFKHQNISAVLVNLGQPFIKGYLPRYNYQKLLEDKVIEHLVNNKNNFEPLFREFSEKAITKINPTDFNNLIVDPPKTDKVHEPIIPYERKPIKINYLEREQRNMNLGEAGEQLVLQFEKWKLRNIGKDKFADQVEWISKDQGDGAGFDVLSKDEKGKDKYIEVKTTKLSKETPFYFSKDEFDFSKEQRNRYHLYRVFNFNKDAKMFIQQGSMDVICQYYPISYKGYF